MLFSFNEFVFDATRHQLSRAGAPVKVEAQVLDLLGYLLKHPGRVVSKPELISEVWQGRALSDNVISVCVAKLRKVLGGAGNRYVSVSYGRGYRFMGTVHLADDSGNRAESVPLAAAVAPMSGSSFVGRGVAIARLQAALDRAREGRGLGCVLLGEAGIGKTRLADLLEQQALTMGFRVSWGRCHGLGSAPPLWPWLQIVRSTYAELPPELAALPSELEALESSPDATGPVSRSISHPWELGRNGTWHKTLTFMTDVIVRTSRAQPWVIVFEDAQWADAASLQLLAHLAVEAAHLPLLLVVTVRDTEMPSDPRSRRALDFVLGCRDWERIELSRLGLQDVAAYTTALLGDSPSDLAEAVFSKSEGNPFFMVELLRPWSDGSRPALSDLRVAGAALDILRDVIGRLAPEARQVLSAAAVVGRSWDIGLLAAITQHAPDALLEMLEQAMTMHVIVASPDNHTHFAFGHDLIRSVLYEDLSTIMRVRIHHRVAEALTARRTTAGSAELAHHLLSALPYGDVMHAVSNARHAARAAIRVGAYSDAAVFVRRALDAMRLRPEAEPLTTCELLYELAICERGAGEPGFASHFEEAVALAQQHRFVEILAAAGQLMSDSPGMITMEGASEVLQAALEAAPDDAHSLKAILLAHLSWTSPMCSRADRVAKLIDESAHQITLADNLPATRTLLRARLYYAGGPDDHEAALAIGTEMERLVSHSSRQRARWSLEPNLARLVTLMQRGDLAHAERALEAFGAAAHELHHAEFIWFYDRMSTAFRMNFGEFEDAKVRLTELKDRAERLKLWARHAIEAVDWGQLLDLTGGMSTLAGELASHFRPQAADCPCVNAVKLKSLVQFGLIDEARVNLEAVRVEDLYLLPKSRDYLATLGHLASTSVATGSLSHCAALYELLKPYPSYCVVSLSIHIQGVVAHFLATLARALGKREVALEHFAYAIDQQERLKLAPQCTQTRYELAHMLSESNDARARKRARELLERVRDDARRLTMQPLAAAADQLLDRLARDNGGASANA